MSRSSKKEIKEEEKNLNTLINEIKDKRLKKIELIVGIVIVILIMIISFILFIPSIKFNGNDTISYKDKFNYKDYTCKNIIGNYKDKVIIKGKVKNKVGEYKLIYSLKYGILKIKKVRTIKVIDNIKPIITLEGNIEEVVCPNKEYNEAGYKAIDEYDGDITSKVFIDKKDNLILYSVKDKSNNLTIVERNINYEDKEKPNITFTSNNTTIYVGDTYNDEYKAIDNCDGDITSKVQVTGNVNSNVVGEYNVNYKIVDSNNNETSIDRKITVKERTLIRPQGGGSGKGIVYLTFDDGPNEGTTNVILDILKEEGVSATFFVTGNGPDYLIKRMYDEGHTVALHTNSHNYSYVYSSEDNYFNDLNNICSRVERITGTKSIIIRFPGGSSNTVSRNYNSGIMTRLTSEVTRRGYHYFDWNVDSNDAAGASTNGVYSNVVNNISLYRENVVLMHDIKSTTRDALRNIIRYGKNNGFTFDKITNDTKMVTHGVNN